MSGNTVWTYLRRPEGEIRDVAPELIRLAWSSPAALAITPAAGSAQSGTRRPDERAWPRRRKLALARDRAHVVRHGTFEWLRELTDISNRISVTGAFAMQVESESR